MNLTSAPFIVPGHEHDVALATTAVVPLIILTVLLPEIPDDLRGRQFQYMMRGFTIVFGFSAGVTAFLQLAGESTRAGTITVLILLGLTALFAIFAMAWPVLRELATIGGLTLVALAGGWLYVGLFILFYILRVKTASDRIQFWIGASVLSMLLIAGIIWLRWMQLKRNKRVEQKRNNESCRQSEE